MKRYFVILAALLIFAAGAASAEAPTLTVRVEMVFENLTSQQAVEKVQQIMKADLGGVMTYTITQRQAGISGYIVTPNQWRGSFGDGNTITLP